LNRLAARVNGKLKISPDPEYRELFREELEKHYVLFHDELLALEEQHKD